MCLSAEALALFINLLPAGTVASEPGRFILQATDREVHWVAVEDRWCTMAPQFDRMERLAEAEE